MNQSNTGMKETLQRFRPVWALGIMALLISGITRLVLLVLSYHQIDKSFPELIGILGRGMLFDLASTSFVLVPLALQVGFINEAIYRRPWRWIFLSVWLIIVLILAFSNLVPVEFSKEIHWAIAGYMAIRLLVFYFLGTKNESFRNAWRLSIVRFELFLFAFLLLFNAVSEYFFWDEFSSRYNFIAVDYLVYTNEVVGNIRESYPIMPIILVILLLSFIIQRAMRNFLRPTFSARPGLFLQAMVLALLLSLPVITYLGVNHTWKTLSRNNYVNELSGNGLYEFAYAFQHNELDFDEFYDTLSLSEAFAITRKSLAQRPFLNQDEYPGELNVGHPISYQQPEEKLNVVMISVESLSADFLGVFGNTGHLTPNLDTLAAKSLFFTRAYASGTRTVRGLEALSLSVPPPPGQSIVKRSDNKGLFTLGSLFQSKGYISQYIYGGYSYFDNMQEFFGSNGYQVIDRTALKSNDIHYANIWGVADEDLFNLAIHTLDSNARTGKPFFSHIMTVSNHRPYTYPENRIDIPPSKHSREGAVKYTDYAIGKFLHDAASKPWFSNTIFVIVADHCASASGKTALPVTGYHIPLFIYAPSRLEPRQVDRLTAQIDIAPSILGLLHFRYNSQFFGDDILQAPSKSPHAFISTYEGLGYLTDSILIVQSPVKKIQAFKPDFKTGKSSVVPVNDSIAKVAKALYQTSNWLAKHHHS